MNAAIRAVARLAIYSGAKAYAVYWVCTFDKVLFLSAQMFLRFNTIDISDIHTSIVIWELFEFASFFIFIPGAISPFLSVA